MTYQDYLKLRPGDRVRSIHGLPYQVEEIEGSQSQRFVWFSLAQPTNPGRTRHAAAEHRLPPVLLLPTTIVREAA
jgi:hypothetical protein